MSISFSGLASGLDTSSWIKSLTALKQAKVTTLEEQKSGVQLQLDTLNNIKTFFNSFRSLLEKVTDSKFNVGSMNLFAQKIATSSNTNILTASVSPEAAPGTYEIKVDSLASNTSAISGYKEYTTTSSSEKATGATLLKSLGVKTGNISVDGTLVRVSENDSIDAFARKLNNIGVKAEFDERNGIFSINKDVSKITDVDNTGIVSGLHLSGVNHGYSSKPLLEYSQEVVTNYADGSTKFSELGVTAGRIEVRDNSNNSYYVDLESDDTIQDLINVLGSEGISASISDGVFSIDNANIVDAGTTNLIDALGLSTANVSNMLVTAGLTANRTLAADGTTTLKEIGISDNATLEFSGYLSIYRPVSTLTISNTLTIDELFDILDSRGYMGEINDGIVTIENKNNNQTRLSLSGGTLLDELGCSFRSFSTRSSKSLNLSLSMSTTLGSIAGFQGGGLGIKDRNGNARTITISTTDTFETLNSKLSPYGISIAGFRGDNNDIVDFEFEGSSAITNAGGSLASNLYELFGFSGLTIQNSTDRYTSSRHTVVKNNQPLTYDTTISEAGIAAGDARFSANGAFRTVTVSSADTIQSLCVKFAQNGMNAYLNDSNQLVIKSADGSDIFNLGSGSMNPTVRLLSDLLSSSDINNYQGTLTTGTTTITHTSTITESTKIKDTINPIQVYFVNSVYGGFDITVDGVRNRFVLSEDETFGSLINRFKESGVNAAIEGDKFVINAGSKAISVAGAGWRDLLGGGVAESRLVSTLGLTYDDDMGGFTSSTEQVYELSRTEGYQEVSAANYALENTKLKDLNITTGTFSLFKNGEKHVITIEENDTIRSLADKVYREGFDLGLPQYSDGHFAIRTIGGETISVGTTVDTSNISSILGFKNKEDWRVVSARTVYQVNGNSVLTDSGLFRAGQVTEGTFTIGDAEFEITADTTLNGLISQINSSQKSNATAYWDSVKGEFVLKSRSSGSVFVSVESGTSNFTDIMGFTATERNADNSIATTKLETERQVLGGNAKFSINGTNYTSTSNTVTSDVSRIEGLTINLKNVSQNGESVTLEIEQDKEVVSNAMEEIVNSYNDLIENVDKELAQGGNLHNQSTLKLIRNQIRSLMTSSLGGNSTFRNLDSIGISLEAASANNIKTGNINKLSFNKNKFEEALSNNENALKSLLVGDDTSKGILTRVEDLIEQTLSSGTGYFSSAERSYNSRIEKYNSRITRANASVERYRALLERKFKAMDNIIAKIQNQYSSFLGT